MSTVLQNKPQGTYTFASQPRAVQQRNKYRNQDQENEATSVYGNIMYDRRIVRGNTYAQHTLPASAHPDPIEIQRQQETRRRNIARKRAKQQLKPKSPEPVEGRKHMDVQTELYLEELSDRVEEADQECQTDTFLDRPPSPVFIPACTGISVATQINEGDLFDFDVEVKPMLEVLVGKTVEQSLLEVMEEDELANLRSQQRAFQELRNAELVEQQRLAEQERRHREEKERRMKQQREVLRKEKETADKIAARAFAQSYLADLVPSVFGTLSDNGYFYDPVERDVEQFFMPWLVDRVEEQLNKSVMGRAVLDSMIREVVKERFNMYAKLEEKLVQEQQSREALHAAVEEKLGQGQAEVTEAQPQQVEEPEQAPAVQAEEQEEAAQEPEEGQTTEEAGDGEPAQEEEQGEEE